MNIEELKKELEKLDKQREALANLIGVMEGENSENTLEKTKSGLKISSGSLSIRGRVVDAVVELIHNKGRQVNNKEILNYVEEKQLSLGSGKKKAQVVGAILSQEITKKSARLKRVATGTYDIK